MHKQYSHKSLSFIFGVAPLLAGLDSTPVESRRNTSMASLLASLVITLVELLASPFYPGILSLLSPFISFLIFSFLFVQRIVHRHLFISWGGRGILTS